MFEKVKELIGKLKPQNEKSVRLLEEAKAELAGVYEPGRGGFVPLRDAHCGKCAAIDMLLVDKGSLSDSVRELREKNEILEVRIKSLETIKDHLRGQLKSQLKSLICTGCEENERLKEERDQLRADMDFIRERVCSAFRGM
jgi:hypothetical protein